MNAAEIPPNKEKDADSIRKPGASPNRDPVGCQGPDQSPQRMREEWEDEVLRSQQIDRRTQTRGGRHIHPRWRRNDPRPNNHQRHVHDSANDGSQDHRQDTSQNGFHRFSVGACIGIPRPRTRGTPGLNHRVNSCQNPNQPTTHSPQVSRTETSPSFSPPLKDHCARFHVFPQSRFPPFLPFCSPNRKQPVLAPRVL